MPGLNQVTLIGRLGKDPEVKNFQNGGRICNLSVATSERWKDKTSGEQKERTEWHNVVIKSDGAVGVAERFLRKGSEVGIIGKLETRKWQDSSGADRYTTEVVVGPVGQLILVGGGQGAKPDAGGGALPQPEDIDDDVPFARLDMWAREPGRSRRVL